MSNFGTHVKCIDKWTLSYIGAAHDENLANTRIFIVEFIVILSDSFNELVYVPLVQWVDQFQTLFMLVFLDEIVGT